MLVQVRADGDERGRGARPADVAALVRHCMERSHLGVDGLMTMPPPGLASAALRACFGAVRELRSAVAREVGVELPHLSMGMSGDFPDAIAEGATMIRLGRELFGTRGPRPWRRNA